MSQIEQTPPPAQQALSTNSIITYIDCGDGTIIIVSIVSPDGQTDIFGNGIGKAIVPMNRFTWKKESPTPVEKQKQYMIHFENDTCNVYLGETRVHTFNDIFGLPKGRSLENVSFRQFKYVPIADDERTMEFTRLLRQLVSAYPDRFCLEEQKKQKTANVGGTKVRIPQPIFNLLIQLLIHFRVPTYSFVVHLINCSIGVFRGDADVYVPNREEANHIIAILTTTLGFEPLVSKPENGNPQQAKAKSNELTFKLYLDILSKHLNVSPEELIRKFNLPEGSDPANYYIELEIKIATDFQKAYESNCLGYFIGLLLSHFLKISISGVSLSLSKERKISIDVGSFDEFLKKLGIVLDGIMTAQDFIDRLLRSTLISEIIVVKDFLRVFISIMGEEKTMHTSKSLREYLHLLLCGLKKRFPDRFSSLETKLVIEENFRDEQSGQMIHTWYVKLFVLNSESQRFEVQMEKGTLWIDDGGNKWFISTGADGNSLIFSETPLKTDSGKKPLPQSVKPCSELYQLTKEEYFDCLKELNHPQIKKFIDALKCRSEVDSHVSGVVEKICKELMDPLYPLSRKKKDSMDGKVYGELTKCQPDPDVFSQFQKFCVDGLDIVPKLNEIFDDYSLRIGALSQELTPEEHKEKRKEIYAAAILKIEELCLKLVRQWTSFHNSDINWTYDESGFFHIPSQTYHEPTSDHRLPYYLGTSVLIDEDSSEPSKGKKQKGKQEGKKTEGKPVPEEKPEGKPVPEEKPEGKPVPEEKPEGKPVPEEKPEGKPVHVFMNGQTGEVFTVCTMPISE
jgi:hypothetical protein